jgi:hypothetical protein
VLRSCVEWGRHRLSRAQTLIADAPTKALLILQSKGAAPTLQCPDQPLLQFLGTARSPAEQHRTHKCWVLPLEPCQGRRPQAEPVPGGGTQARAPPKQRSASLEAVGTSPDSATSVLRCWQKQLEMELRSNTRMCHVLKTEMVGEKEELQRGSLSSESLQPVRSSGSSRTALLAGRKPYGRLPNRSPRSEKADLALPQGAEARLEFTAWGRLELIGGVTSPPVAVTTQGCHADPSS